MARGNFSVGGGVTGGMVEWEEMLTDVIVMVPTYQLGIAIFVGGIHAKKKHHRNCMRDKRFVFLYCILEILEQESLCERSVEVNQLPR